MFLEGHGELKKPSKNNDYNMFLKSLYIYIKINWPYDNACFLPCYFKKRSFSINCAFSNKIKLGAVIYIDMRIYSSQPWRLRPLAIFC